MRRTSYEPQWSWTVILLVINVVIFVGEQVAIAVEPRVHHFVNQYLALSIDGMQRGCIWQLLTFQFLHDGPWPWHLLFNGIALYFFGRSVEDALGRKSFLKLYLLSGVLGGALQLIVTAVFPGRVDAPVVGASAGILGLLAAYATMFPEREITLLLFFFFPVHFKAKYLLWFAGLFSLYGTIVPFEHIAHTAHLGGMIGGYAYLRWGIHAENLLWARRPRRARLRPRELVKVHSPKASGWQQPKHAPEELPPAEFISREVDPILDKISAHGIQSLTPEEKQILEAARSRMGKR